MSRRLLFLVLILAVVLGSRAAVADDFYVIPVPVGTGAKITSLPHTISSPGFYYLGENLASSGMGIKVSSANVTIDFMGFTITGPKSESSIGIYMPGANNIEIRNGTITNFGMGICDQYNPFTDLVGSNMRVVNMRVLGNSSGIRLQGISNLVQNCNVSNNGWDGIHAGDGKIIGCTANGNGGNGIESSVMVSGCITQHNKSSGIISRGGNVVDNYSYGNTENGIYSDGSGTIVGNTCIYNKNGFNIFSYIGAPNNRIIDRNSASGNTSANWLGNPAGTVWGLNGGK